MSWNVRTEMSPRRAGEGPRRLRIVVAAGPDAGLVFEPETTDTIAVGTAGDNELELRDPTVSRYHLELRQGPEGIDVQDLGSLNGTYVGGVRIRSATLPAGTRLSLGESVLEVQDGDRIEPVETDDPAAIPGLIAHSASMKAVAREIHKLAGSDISVLVQGETGTGKEIVAEALHRLGPRADGPFEVVDCGSMPSTLIAAELFGHERGAFTGADRRRPGAFERASGGTLFLDEIGELPLDLQPALLGALERRRFRRVGGDKEVEIDVRIVAATHRDLRSEVNTSAFRPDLYYRLAVARVVIPALRDRPEDIEPLVQHFTAELTGGTETSLFGSTAMEVLRGHRWSGNVRELRNVVESALAMGRLMMQGQDQGPVRQDDEVVPYGEARAAAIHRFEQSYLRELIETSEHNASLAARRAKVDRPHLLSLLRKHGLR